MHVLLVYCHPGANSFCAVLRDTAVAALTAARHTVHVRDLYAEGFVPAMSANERGRYYTDMPNRHGIEEHISYLSTLGNRPVSDLRSVLIREPDKWS